MTEPPGTLVAWRVAAWEYRDRMMTGAGSANYGGRYNSAGRAAAYAAGNIALAMLERLAQERREDLAGRYAACRVTFDRNLAEDIGPDLPPDWRDDYAATQRIGDGWLASARSAALRVPSAVLPFADGGSNYVFNPAHPDFGAVVIEPPREFRFDPRLLRGR